jgi:hypothetical protein
MSFALYDESMPKKYVAFSRFCKKANAWIINLGKHQKRAKWMNKIIESMERAIFTQICHELFTSFEGLEVPTRNQVQVSKLSS